VDSGVDAYVKQSPAPSLPQSNDIARDKLTFMHLLESVNRRLGQLYRRHQFTPSRQKAAPMDTDRSEIVPLRTCANGPVLICMHCEHFEHMAAAIPIDSSVYGMRLVDLDRPNEDLTVEQVAESHAQVLCGRWENGPYILLGYSFGGLVAYEMARILLNRGKEIPLLALFDTPHPNFQRNLSQEESEVVRKKYLADRQTKYLLNLMKGRLDQIVLDTSKYLIKKAQPIYWKIIKASCKALNLSLPSTSESLRLSAMWHSYTPKEFSGHMVLFRAEGRDAEFGDDLTMGWRRSLKNGVDVQFAHGSHEMMMGPPYVRNLVTQLTPYLPIRVKPSD
jgi:thioesterase domain-containing protein